MTYHPEWSEEVYAEWLRLYEIHNDGDRDEIVRMLIEEVLVLRRLTTCRPGVCAVPGCEGVFEGPGCLGDEKLSRRLRLDEAIAEAEARGPSDRPDSCPNCDHGTDPATLTTCDVCEGTGLDPRGRELAELMARERSLTLDEARAILEQPLRDAVWELAAFSRSQTEHRSDRRRMYEGLYAVPTSLGMLPGYIRPRD